MTSRGMGRIRTGVATAVAGLALTGPAFAQSRDLLRSAVERSSESAPGRGVERSASQRRENDGRPERTDRTTRTIPLGPNGSLELKNISGDIVVSAGTGRDVSLEIVRHSRGRTDADAALGLEQVQVTVDHRGERAAVEPVYPRERTPYQVSISFTVTAPAGTRITAKSISGNVIVKGLSGDVAVETVSGRVEVANAKRVSKARSISGDVVLTDIDSDQVLSAGTLSGGVQMTRVKASRVSVEVISGNLRTDDLTCDSAQMKSLSGSVDYVGRFSAGGRYEFSSHSGSVHVTALGPVGFELQATTFSGRIRPEGLALQAMTMNRGSLRATIGDGSAVVVAQTFSGDVVVTKK